MLFQYLLPLLALLVPLIDGAAVSIEGGRGGCRAGAPIRKVYHKGGRKNSTISAVPTNGNVAIVVPSPSPSATTTTTTLAPSPSPSTPAAAAPTTAAPSAPVTPAGDAEKMLQLHNDFRKKYGANALKWNDDLASFASNYGGKCDFKHSGGPYGENLAAGTGSGYTVTSAFNAWANEASQYNWNNPGFASGTGHFTQVVWKATTELGCGFIQCDGGTIFSQKSLYVICEYRVGGNMVGDNGRYFRENVGTLQG